VAGQVLLGDVVFALVLGESLAKCTRSRPYRSMNSPIAVTNALVIGAINADEAKAWPRWKWKNPAAPRGYCSSGW
jgi:hypothetical protein